MPKGKDSGNIPTSEREIASWANQKFKEAMIAKEPYTSRWFTYLSAWNNSLYEKNTGSTYKTSHASNFIYSTIESMRPIMFDKNPKFEVLPLDAESIDFANDVTTLFDWEWHRTNMQELMLANSIYTFTIGTSIIMLKYSYEKGADGDVDPVKISPFNLYPDPLATSVEDAEYIIYADYVHVNKLKQQYPKSASHLSGSDVKYSELVNDRNDNAKIDNQVLVLEVYCRDWTTIDVEEDGEVKKKRKYPNGRVITVAPEIGVVLEDKENPYETGRFPFFLFKDIDVPFQFWGEGEVRWLLSPQEQANELYNQIIDNAKNTANMQWIIDKNAGIPKGTLTNRPGLIIRKNPGSEVRRDSPPAMPMYVQQMIDTLKFDIEVIAGVHDVTRGETPTGIQSAAAIIALQEAAQIRIRLKTTLYENALGVLGTEWLARLRQFWKLDRKVPKKIDDKEMIPAMQLNGMEMQPNMPMQSSAPAYTLLDISPDRQLKYDYRVKVVGSSVMQNSRASMLDQMIRLMQTPAEDGMPCVPREAVLDYLPDTNKKQVLSYFQKLKEEQQQQQQQQMMNNEQLQQLQMLGQQIQEIGSVVNSLQNRVAQDDEAKKREEIMTQGYQQGVNEASLMQTQMEKTEPLPPELLQQIAELDDEAFAMLMQEHPELADMIE